MTIVAKGMITAPSQERFYHTAQPQIDKSDFSKTSSQDRIAEVITAFIFYLKD
jgi:hypothetical protein